MRGARCGGCTPRQPAHRQHGVGCGEGLVCPRRPRDAQWGNNDEQDHCREGGAGRWVGASAPGRPLVPLPTPRVGDDNAAPNWRNARPQGTMVAEVASSTAGLAAAKQAASKKQSSCMPSTATSATAPLDRVRAEAAPAAEQGLGQHHSSEREAAGASGPPTHGGRGRRAAAPCARAAAAPQPQPRLPQASTARRQRVPEGRGDAQPRARPSGAPGKRKGGGRTRHAPKGWRRRRWRWRRGPGWRTVARGSVRPEGWRKRGS